MSLLRHFETGEVRSAFRCIDVVYKAVDILRVGIIVLHGNLNQHVVLLALAMMTRSYSGLPAAV